ncbi:hypothetical protein GCM10009118_23950 [Wandonia haliotis]|uniref:Uncharacterized protein n=1 Tax=Wandonia haliotis TaxID=574963 RepID=A0ABP3Y384_9FLAO
MKKVVFVLLLLTASTSFSQDSVFVYKAETNERNATLNKLNFDIIDVWSADVFHESHNFKLDSTNGVYQWINKAFLTKQDGEIQTVFLSWGMDGGVNSILTRSGEDEFLNYSILHNKLSIYPECVTIRKDTLIIKELRIVDDPFTYVDSCVYENYLYFNNGLLRRIESYSKCPFDKKTLNPKHIQHYNYFTNDNNYFIEVTITDRNNVFQYKECFKYVVPERYKMTKLEMIRPATPLYIRWEFLPLLVENVKGITELYYNDDIPE